MIFIFKKKKLVVDAFTRHQLLIDQLPIDHARNYMPSWWKSAPNSFLVDNFVPHATIKSCVGVLDMYKLGLIMPLWTDIAFKIEPDGSYFWQCADRMTELSAHNPEQWNMFADPNKFGHVKIESEWVLKTRENVDWMFMQPYWNMGLEQPYTISTGIFNSYYTQLPLNVQMMIDKRTPRNFSMKSGSALAHIIPITDKEIEVRHHLVDLPDWIKYTVVHKTRFLNGYKHRIKGCPFHKKG